MIEDDGETITIRHCYVERRMMPLNLYLDRATPEELEHAVLEYGNAIRDLAIANIFPGDMLWRNFGVTRDGRVVFYDYDEIEYLTDCTSGGSPKRRIRRPSSPASRGTASAARRLPGGVRDVPARGPAAARALPAPSRRPARARVLAGLPAPHRGGEIVDFFPYPESLRFCNR